MGGSRRGKLITYRNIFLTMVISGLWHGAAWKFIVWGALHGAGSMLTRGLERSAAYRERVPTILKRIWVFAFVSFAWIFFGAHNLSEAWLIVTRIFTAEWVDPRFPLLALVLILAVWTYQLLYDTGARTRRVLELAPVRLGLAAAMVAYILVVAQPSAKAFIYFQF